MVTGHTAASFAWSHQLPELQRLTDAELGAGRPSRARRAPSGHRASMYWAAFRGTRHPDAVADVINFLTTNGEVGRLLGHERGLNASLAVRRFVEGSITDPAQRACRRPRRQHRRPARAGAGATARRGTPRCAPCSSTAAESIRVRRAGTRAATARFLAQANAALAV